MSSLHECPCGCGGRIKKQRLACRAGWYALPAAMRDDVVAALARKDYRGHREALGNALGWYRERSRERA